MNFELRFWLNILWVFLHQTTIIQARLHAFLLDDPTVMKDCKNEPDYLGVADFVEISKSKIEFFDDHVHVEGNFTMLWDVEPDGRVQIKTDVLKHERGVWMPTSLTLIERDFCKAMFNEDNVWYKSWTQHVDPDDWKCINNKGHTYHHKAFDLEATFEAQGDLSGRYKLVTKVDSYNKQNIKQPNSVCVETEGEIVKK